MPLLLSLIGLVGAAIPLVVAILPLLRQRTEETTQLLDSQSLWVLKIIRHPVEDRIWKKIKRKHRRRTIRDIILLFILSIIAAIIPTIIIYNFLKLSPLESGNWGTVIWTIDIFLYLLAITLYIIRYKNSFIRRATPDQASYFVFSEVEILVESEYKYLFDKCHEALRVLGNQLSKVDFENKYLVAYKPSKIFSHFESITVQIEALTNKDKCFHIQVTVTPSTSDKKKDKISDGSEESSKIVNQFINYLISDNKLQKT